MTNTEPYNENLFPIIEVIRERDIDLLIIEELYVQNNFDQFFLKRINKLNFKFLEAHHSIISSGLGETDILIEYVNNNGKKLYILVENKINAEFQDNQYNRYIERANELKQKGNEAYIILTAPESYISRQKEFEYTISYEEIKEWFLINSSEKNRGWYKTELLRLAIEQERRGYQVIKNDIVTNLWKQYFEYIQRIFPELKMSNPKDKPKQSSFVYFHPKWLPNKTKLIHKMNNGYIDFELSGKANEYNKIIEEFSSKLLKDMEIVITGKSICFRFELPVISFEESFDEQERIMVELINKCKLFKDFITNKDFYIK